MVVMENEIINCPRCGRKVIRSYSTLAGTLHQCYAATGTTNSNWDDVKVWKGKGKVKINNNFIKDKINKNKEKWQR